MSVQQSNFKCQELHGMVNLYSGLSCYSVTITALRLIIETSQYTTMQVIYWYYNANTNNSVKTNNVHIKSRTACQAIKISWRYLWKWHIGLLYLANILFNYKHFRLPWKSILHGRYTYTYNAISDCLSPTSVWLQNCTCIQVTCISGLLIAAALARTLEDILLWITS